MNTTVILVIIFIGFIFVNNIIDSVKEGFDGNYSEQKIDSLINKIRQKNSNLLLNEVDKDMNDILNKYDMLNKKINAQTKSKSYAKVTDCDKHISCPKGAPPRDIQQPPPREGCPNKYNTLQWPKKIDFNLKNKNNNSDLISNENRIQVTEIWKPTYSDELNKMIKTKERMFNVNQNSMYIEELGNEINNKLQEKNF